MKQKLIREQMTETKVPTSQLKVGDRIYFSFLNAEVDKLVSLPSGATKVYGHFIVDGEHHGFQLLATCTDRVSFTVFNRPKS